MRKLFFTCCFIYCCLFYAGAQKKGFVYTDSTLADKTSDDQTNDEEITEADTTLYLHPITLSADTIASWKNNKKFAYVKNLDSLLKLKDKENLSLQQTQQTSASFLQELFSSGIIQFILWAIAAGIVLFILYRLFLSKGIFRRTVSLPAVEEMADEQVFENASDYDSLIQQSFKLEDYRMAVRYLFLKTLWQLEGKGMLERRADKTNYKYVQEIAEDKKNDFASLVLNYEYIWYGNLKISREQYGELEKRYGSFYNKIK